MDGRGRALSPNPLPSCVSLFVSLFLSPCFLYSFLFVCFFFCFIYLLMCISVSLLFVVLSQHTSICVPTLFNVFLCVFSFFCLTFSLSFSLIYVCVSTLLPDCVSLFPSSPFSLLPVLLSRRHSGPFLRFPLLGWSPERIQNTKISGESLKCPGGLERLLRADPREDLPRLSPLLFVF